MDCEVRVAQTVDHIIFFIVFYSLTTKFRKPCSRLQLAGMLIEMESGNHISYKNAEFYDCSAFRLDASVPGVSYNDIDGEVVESGRIQGKVLPGALNILT